MRIADRVWDGLETDAGDDSELAAEVRRRIGSEEVDGPAAIEAARKRARP